MTDTERQLGYFCHRLHTANLQTDIIVAGLESIAKDSAGALDWPTIWAALLDIERRYSALEGDLQKAAGLTDAEIEVTD